MSELRQAVNDVKTQGKFHRAFLKVVDALDKFENFDASYHSAENHAAQARDRLKQLDKDVDVAEVDKGVLTAEVEALHIEKARASNAASQEAQAILKEANLRALDIIEEVGLKAKAFDEEITQKNYAAKEAHDTAMKSYNEQQHEAHQHLLAVKEELAALKARFDT